MDPVSRTTTNPRGFAEVLAEIAEEIRLIREALLNRRAGGDDG